MAAKLKPTDTVLAAPLASVPLIDHGDAHGAGEPSARTIPAKYLATDATGAPIVVEPVTPTAIVRHLVLRSIVVGPEAAE